MHNSSTTYHYEEKPVSATNETLDDYTLRYAPHSFRRWSHRVVAITALGEVAYLTAPIFNILINPRKFRIL